MLHAILWSYCQKCLQISQGINNVLPCRNSKTKFPNHLSHLFNDFGATSTSRGLVIENPLLEKISFPLFIQNLFDKKKTSTEGEKRKENFFDFVWRSFFLVFRFDPFSVRARKAESLDYIPSWIIKICSMQNFAFLNVVQLSRNSKLFFEKKLLKCLLKEKQAFALDLGIKSNILFSRCFLFFGSLFLYLNWS